MVRIPGIVLERRLLQRIPHRNVARLEAARQASIADRQLETDVLLFTTWVAADLQGGSGLADEIALRFPRHFIPAFNTWRSLPAAPGGNLPAGTPFELSEYILPTQAEVDAAYERAEAASAAADIASGHSNRYVLSTVLFASVLFLAGIADKLKHRTSSHAVVLLAGLTLTGAVAVLATVPVHLAID